MQAELVDTPTEVTERRMAWLAKGVVAAGAIAAVFATPYIPTNDGPQHILSSYLEAHYMDPGTLYAEQLAPTFQFAGRGFAFLFGPLLALFEWQLALQIALCAMVIAFGSAFARFVRALHPGRSSLAPLGFVLAFSWTFYMGFFSFSLGVALVLLALSLQLRPIVQGSLARALLASLMLVASLCHVVAALLGMVLLCVVEVTRWLSDREARPRDLALRLLPASLAPMTWAIMTAATTDRLGSASAATSIEWLDMAAWSSALAGFVLPGPRVRGWIVLFGAIGALAYGVRRWRQYGPDARGIAVGAVAFLIGGFFMPVHIPGWQFVAPRLLSIGTALAVAFVPVELLSGVLARTRPLLIAGIALASLFITGAFHQSLHSACADELSGLSLPLRRSGNRLPVIIDVACGKSSPAAEREIPLAELGLHVPALYAVAQGGTLPALFAGNSSAHAFIALPRSFPPMPPEGIANEWMDPQLRPIILQHFAAIGSFYEDVLLLGVKQEEVSALLARGYELNWQQGRFAMLTPKGCAPSIEIASTPTGGILRTSYGLVPLLDPVWTARVTARATPTTPVRIPLESAPCGAIWIRTGWQAAPDSPLRFCREAMPDGRLVVNAIGGDLFRCHIDP